jgi:deazaflavin-dependent oxidoreductase (nitroreductase family)
MKEGGGTIRGPSPKGWLRVLLRLPVLLYRLRLGWLLGHRFLLLTYVGRKSGLQRRTVLEVVCYTRESRTCLVASGWGEKAQWFKNILARPEVAVILGMQTYPARAQRLPRSEAAQAFREYADRHPWAIKHLTRLMVGTPYQGLEDDFVWLAEHVPLVALRFVESAPCGA